MGYTATMDGLITLRKPIVTEDILECVYDFLVFNAPDVHSVDENTMTFSFVAYQSYIEELIVSFLADIEPYTESGEITYVGYDNSLWRHYFDPERKCWLEQKGYVEYESGGTTIASKLSEEQCSEGGKAL